MMGVVAVGVTLVMTARAGDPRSKVEVVFTKCMNP
jgi:hypothetical protein